MEIHLKRLGVGTAALIVFVCLLSIIALVITMFPTITIGLLVVIGFFMIAYVIGAIVIDATADDFDEDEWEPF